MSNEKSRIVRFHELDVEKFLSINKPVLNPNNNVYNAIMLYDNLPFVLETPYLKNPFGVKSYKKGNSNFEERSITLMSCGTYTDSHESIVNFFNQLKKIDSLMLLFGEKYSEKLFGKKLTLSEVENYYDKGVRGKLDKDGLPYPDKISPRVMKSKDNLPKIIIFQSSKTPIEINSWNDLENNISPGTSLRGIIQPKIYLSKERFGILYEYHQIKLPSLVTKSNLSLGTYCFSDDS